MTTRSRCLVSGSWRASSASTLAGVPGVGRDEQAGGELVVLGLADQVGGEVGRVGGVVGDDADLGRPVLAVDADGALQHGVKAVHWSPSGFVLSP